MEASPSARGTGVGPSRIVWIDELRFVAFCAVVLLHVSWTASTVVGPHDLIAFTTRFAVPVFFMISGFMIGQKRRTADEVVHGMLRRLVPVFLFWEAVYILLDVVLRGALYPLPEPTATGVLRFVVITFYNGGVAFHLWFVFWLAVSVTIFVALRGFGPVVSWCGVGGLMVIGLALGPYGGFTGLADLIGPFAARPGAFTGRNGPFFGPLFLAIGDLVARRRLVSSPAVALGLVALGWTAQIGEGVVIAAHGPFFVANWDVTIGTPVLALGVFLLFQAAGERFAGAGHLARLGRLSLGMYCVHVLFTSLWNARFLPIERVSMPVPVTLLGAAGCILASVLLTVVIARVRALRLFVA